MSNRTSKSKRRAQPRPSSQTTTPETSRSLSDFGFTPLSQLASTSPSSSIPLALAPTTTISSSVPSPLATSGNSTFQPPVSLAQIAATTSATPVPSWPISGLLPSGLCLLAAKPHAGSHSLALQLALSIARGTLALDHFPTNSGEVLYLGFHDTPHTIIARTHHLLDSEILPTHLSWTNTWQDWQQDGFTALNTWLEEHPHTRLLVIDSLYNLLPPGTPTRRAYALLHQLNRLAHSHHLTILILHSLARFSARDPFDAIPCSPILLETCETLAVLEHDRSSSQATLHLTGHTLSIRSLPLVRETASDIWSLDTSTVDDALSPDANEADLSLSDLPSIPRSLRDLASDLKQITTTQICESSVTPTLSTSLSGGSNPAPASSNATRNAPSQTPCIADTLQQLISTDLSIIHQ